MIKITSPNKRLNAMSAALLGILLCCAYCYVEYSHRYSALTTVLPVTFIVLVTFSLQFLWIDNNARSAGLKRFINILTSAFLLTGVFGSLLTLKAYRMKTELKKYGSHAVGIIERTGNLGYKGTKGDFFVIYSYYANDKLYRQKEFLDRPLKKRDAVKVVYSTKDPELSVIEFP